MRCAVPQASWWLEARARRGTPREPRAHRQGPMRNGGARRLACWAFVALGRGRRHPRQLLGTAGLTPCRTAWCSAVEGRGGEGPVLGPGTIVQGTRRQWLPQTSEQVHAPAALPWRRPAGAGGASRPHCRPVLRCGGPCSPCPRQTGVVAQVRHLGRRATQLLGGPRSARAGLRVAYGRGCTVSSSDSQKQLDVSMCTPKPCSRGPRPVARVPPSSRARLASAPPWPLSLALTSHAPCPPHHPPPPSPPRAKLNKASLMDVPQAALELVRVMALSTQHRRAASYR